MKKQQIFSHAPGKSCLLSLRLAACSLWLLLLPSSFCLFFLTACATSRPDLVWTPDNHQKGVASWYDEQGKRTANGEIFNRGALTAAHPSLALNTIVEVTNLRNGKKIRVRINDRLPPIHEGRVIDLTPYAFAALDSPDVGLINVEVRVVQFGNNKYTLLDRSVPAGKMYLNKVKTTSGSTLPVATLPALPE